MLGWPGGACGFTAGTVTSDEIRVFPLNDSGADRDDALDDLLFDLERAWYHPAVESVPFEFQRGADACPRLEA